MNIPAGFVSPKSLRKRLTAFRGRYREVADISGLTYSTVSKIACGERGRRSSYSTICALDKALHAMETQTAPINNHHSEEGKSHVD